MKKKLIKIILFCIVLSIVNTIFASLISNANIADNLFVNEILGDVNGDGKVSTLDALKVLQAASGRITLTPLQTQAADVNKDNGISTLDALKILQFVSGRITSFESYAKDTSDLPAWTGKQLTINYWNASGVGGNRRITNSPNDVVTPEIKRVTGVTIDENESYDNGGLSYKTKLLQVIASGKFPNIAVGTQKLNELIDKDLIYDLTEYIDKYAPNIKNIFGNKDYISAYITQVSPSGKIYSLPFNLTASTYKNLNSQVDSEKYSYFLKPSDPTCGSYIYVRDDILKMLYPNAKTQYEIEDLWVKNGKFTKEEVLDATIKSKDEFLDFLRKIKALNLSENGRKVYPIFAHSGQDTWALLSFLAPMLNGSGSGSVGANYFTYWDKKTKSVEMMMTKAEFKDTVKYMNKLVLEGLTSLDCFSDTYNTTMEKLNRGEYAVSYAFLIPNNEQIKLNGKPFQYRKVYIDIPIDNTRFIDNYSKSISTGSQMVIFKSSNTEEQVIQLVKWFDYLMSEEGQKLYAWGPRSAGLFSESDGIRQFKDQALVDEIVYKKGSTISTSYNIFNNYDTPSYVNDKLKIYYALDGKNIFAPMLYYPVIRKASDAFANFHYGWTEPKSPLPFFTNPSIWMFVGNGSEKIDSFWAARRTFEYPLLKCVVAQNDSEFEQQWSIVMNNLTVAGYGEVLMQEFNTINKEIVNKTTYENLIGLSN